MPNSSDVANVATISHALRDFNEQFPERAMWKITYNDQQVTKWYKCSYNGWEVAGHIDWDEIRKTHNCGYRLDYRWLKHIISADVHHRNFFYKIFYSSSAEYDIDWDIKEWTEEPSAPYQYLSGGRLYWSDLPR